ncbi:disintegrin and metalloproteinase domain-containing protein 12 [Sceloporus undulatus]|uniref:disintegrin and metalloproteinase domain-containing protein 12 n=1 Tax=Sceloporus undulatus TaxID=8520 RepID=UPI001C4DA162|nr:disintegrin and metalloproteinase domain-containing protein 12 [Sceloporus undulatus]
MSQQGLPAAAAALCLPPAQLCLLCLLFLTSSFFAPAAGAQGEEADSKLKFSRQWAPKNKPEQYEIIVPYFMDGEQWKPIKNFYPQIHPARLKFLIHAEREQLVVILERNDGLFAGNFTETHYLEDGTGAVLMHNYTGHCYYHGHVQDYVVSAVSMSTCSGLRGFILFEDKAYILEPLEGTTNEHIIYQATSLKLASGFCGHHLNISAVTLEDTVPSMWTFTSRHKREALKSTKYVELVIVADNREFQRQGRDVEKVKLRLIEMANYVDKLKAAGILCRYASNSCDLPEFCTGGSPHCPANVYLHDGHSCHRVDGYCYNGMCQTHEQQCITLWGQGAKPAPGICFERVNSAGDPYGNCGKDSKSSFAKCERRDAKCGKIQCQGGANRPVIGTNAVSIETNIPLQEGGKILCRGTHVYLGDDMPDPGLVLAGTKCEDGKICLNRRCQNTSVFGVHECATKCHGRGVCNNKKNCHCEAHWSPPFCDKAGFGGSVDSGPVRQSDNRSLIIGLLITTLCLLLAGLLMYIKRKTLLKQFFINKKTTIEKLRSVTPARPSSSFEPNHFPTILSKNLVQKPQNLYTNKRNDPQRMLRYQIGDISKPVKTQDIGRSSPPERVLPPLCELSCQHSVHRKLLPATPSSRHEQESCKPSPPRKPLPADPHKSKTAHFNNSSRAGHEFLKPVHQLAPLRPVPIRPLHVPRSCNATCMQ